jgi:hypothetical protein
MKRQHTFLVKTVNESVVLAVAKVASAVPT